MKQNTKKYSLFSAGETQTMSSKWSFHDCSTTTRTCSYFMLHHITPAFRTGKMGTGKKHFVTLFFLVANRATIIIFIHRVNQFEDNWNRSRSGNRPNRNTDSRLKDKCKDFVKIKYGNEQSMPELFIAFGENEFEDETKNVDENDRENEERRKNGKQNTVHNNHVIYITLFVRFSSKTHSKNAS